MGKVMDSGSEQPIGAILIAALACIALALFGVGLATVAGVFILWVGSIFLANGRPPQIESQPDTDIISSKSMGKLIKHSATPLLVIEGSKVTLASRSAQRLLGKHIIGQDVRMAFRQPQAIKLLNKQKSGLAIIKGLARRRDIWRMKLQKIDTSMSVIELTSLTAEADISRAHTDFVANASHELRTPLASIIGYVETLREDGTDLDNKTSKKFLETIHREAQRLESLVSDLMSLSRIEAEKHDEPSDIIEFGKLITQAARDAAGAERLDRVNFDIDDTLRIKGDAYQIEQLVRNLTDNALKYGDPEQPVSLQLTEGKDGQARFTVSDRGAGIDPQHLPHLTRRFYRTDPGRSRAAGGTGLGLAIVKHIVERHRGRLDIESQLGKGTSMIIRIPAVTGEVD